MVHCEIKKNISEKSLFYFSSEIVNIQSRFLNTNDYKITIPRFVWLWNVVAYFKGRT
jgi:hypothetical protein